jgi:hypothetical protein
MSRVCIHLREFTFGHKCCIDFQCAGVAGAPGALELRGKFAFGGSIARCREACGIISS